MKNNLHTPSIISIKILLIGLPIIILCFIYLIISFTMHENVSQSVLVHTYKPQLESFMISLTLIVLGAIIIDISENELKAQ